MSTIDKCTPTFGREVSNNDKVDRALLLWSKWLSEIIGCEISSVYVHGGCVTALPLSQH
jgi:hypothetical protein